MVNLVTNGASGFGNIVTIKAFNKQDYTYLNSW